MQHVERSVTFAERAGQALLRGLWYLAIPLLLTGVFVRFCVPSPYSESVGNLGQALGGAIAASPLVAAVVLFLVFALLTRYWRFYLPGGRYLALVPPAVSRRAALHDLPCLESAGRLLTQLESASLGSRLTGRLNAAEQKELALQAAALRSGLEHANVANAVQASGALRTLAARELRSQAHARLLLFALPLLLAIGAASLLRARVFQSYRVLSASMLPTLKPGELVLASGLAYRPFGQSAAAVPRRGDIIVFKHSDRVRGSDELVKRVVGLPGDHISFERGFPVLNGVPVPHCDVGRYADLFPNGEFDGRLLVEFLDDQAYLTVYSAETQRAEPYDVKPGEVFVLGDNRNESLDSRLWHLGRPAGLPFADIDGRVVRVLSRPNRDGTPNLTAFLRPIGLEVDLPGVDTQSLKSGIERCLNNQSRANQSQPVTKP